jgi:hypothetical protein
VGRLLNPGLGELADRYTILQLKILHGDPTNVQHFHAEQAQVLMTMERHASLNSDQVRSLIVYLRTVNGELWTLEDQMAVYAKALLVDPPVVAALGMTIWKLNQERNQLIQRINVAAGTDAGPEKF